LRRKNQPFTDSLRRFVKSVFGLNTEGSPAKKRMCHFLFLANTLIINTLQLMGRLFSLEINAPPPSVFGLLLNDFQKIISVTTTETITIIIKIMSKRI
jgi:hypothetical protein